MAQSRYNSLNKISFYNCCDRILDALSTRYIYTSAGILPDSAGISEFAYSAWKGGNYSGYRECSQSGVLGRAGKDGGSAL